MKRLLLFVLPLLFIFSCSKPVEDSTLINKDGLMYTPDSDKPYTGEVFMNYDTGEKSYQGTYENGLLIQYSYLNKDGSVKEPINYQETLNKRDGVFYTKDTNKPYTGQVFSLYDNGNRKLSGILKGGKKDGLVTSWYKSEDKTPFDDDNGQKRYEETWKNGKEIEKTSWSYYGDGQKRGEYVEIFKDGAVHELDTEWYENGEKQVQSTFKNGKKDGLQTSWFENGQKSNETIYKNRRPHGLRTEWFENGQKKTEGSFKDGEEEGIWTGWYKDGNKKIEHEFKEGKTVGISKFWGKNTGELYMGVTNQSLTDDGAILLYLSKNKKGQLHANQFTSDNFHVITRHHLMKAKKYFITNFTKDGVKDNYYDGDKNITTFFNEDGSIRELLEH